MLHAGLDLSRRRLDICLLDETGELVAETAAPPDVGGLRGLAERVAGYRQPVRAVIESMNGARFVHDSPEEHGWDVLIADAQKVKGLAPLACKTDRIDARVLAVLSQRDLVPAIWLPDPSIRRERELARFRLHLVRHRTTEEPHPRHADHLRAPLPGQRPVRPGRARAARPPSDSRPVAAQRRRRPGADRRPRATDRAADGRTAPPRGRSPLHPAAGHRARVRLDQRLHRRLRDRRHPTLRLAGQALRLHRPMPAGPAVGQHRPARPDLKAPPALPALGPARGGAERLQTPAIRRALPAHQAPPGPPTRPQGRPDRPRQKAHRGDLAHAHPQPALRSGRRRVSSSRLTAHFGNAPPERALPFRTVLEPRGDRDMSTARHHHPARGP
jgi:hypothetical protein